LYGSCATGLALPESDIDLSVLGLEIVPRYQLHIPINLLASILKEFVWVSNLNVILKS
jgi:non-canonical poly(A) RNA polymerase PAPD5/7